MNNRDDFVSNWGEPTEIIEQYREYHLALGEFLDAFSRIEEGLHLVLQMRARVPQKVARAIWSATNVDLSISLTKRLMDVLNTAPPERDELDHNFSQISVINSVRNDILHYGARLQFGGKHEGAFVATNTRAAHVDARLRIIVVTPQLLQNMTADLYHISEQLTLLSGTYPANVADRFGEVKRVPWRYKPAEQGSRVLPPHATDRKRLLRHPPFSE
jgi:hypothetical protein